jgi:anti-sigma factor RsiW
MSDHTNDINELLALFERLSRSTSGSLFARRHHALTALLAERDALAAELAALKAERDKERREACRSDAYAVHGVYTPEELAKGRGWNCFDAPHTNATDVPVQDGGET